MTDTLPIAGTGERTADAVALDDAVAAAGHLPPIVTGTSDEGPATTTTTDVGGVAYTITEQRRRSVNDVVEHAFLQDLAQMGVWPGQVIQGSPLLSGDLAPIGPFARRSGTVQVTTDLIGGTPAPQSVLVDAPTAATVEQARRDILAAVGPQDSPGLLKTDFQRASTFRQVGAKLGVSVKGSAFGVDADATLDQERRQSTVVAVIRQVFYNVTFTPATARASGIWGVGVTPGDLTPYAGPDNPPLYVDSVQYGRFICVAAQAGYSSSEITAALKAQWSGSVSGSASVSGRDKEVLENCQVKIYTLGVPGRSQFQNIGDPAGELHSVFTHGLSYSATNPGVPISFTCRHVDDNALAHVGLVASYTEPLSAAGADVGGAEFEVWDGPGGGPRNTGLLANPGDHVTVSADGDIWTGVAFSGPTGPEGWPGHTADAAAPVPGGTAYCLVARFGNGGWFEAKNLWEGDLAATQRGTLQLASNDNNWDNGDPDMRWRVRVDIKRAGAAAAGVFV